MLDCSLDNRIHIINPVPGNPSADVDSFSVIVSDTNLIPVKQIRDYS
jgi:hypothetical protein